MKLKRSHAVALVVVSLVLILLLSHYTGYANALVAWGTLMLAYATFMLIQNSNEQEKRRREEELAKESRDKKERLLNEIIEWATDVTKWRPKKIFGEIIHTANRLELQHLMFSHIVEIMEGFIEVRGKNQYVSNVARKIDKHLEEGVANLIEVLESKIELLADWKSNLAEARNRVLEENEEGSYFLKAEELENQIEELALAVIEEAVKIKTEDIR